MCVKIKMRDNKNKYTRLQTQFAAPAVRTLADVVDTLGKVGTGSVYAVEADRTIRRYSRRIGESLGYDCASK